MAEGLADGLAFELGLLFAEQVEFLLFELDKEELVLFFLLFLCGLAEVLSGWERLLPRSSSPRVRAAFPRRGVA